MKVLRVLKVIALIVAIISVLVPCAGSFFIMKDACDYKEQVSADDIHAQLDAYDLRFKDLFVFGAKAEGEAEAPAGSADAANDEEVTTQEQSMDNLTGEAPIENTGASETGTEPAPSDVATEPADDGSYKLDKHMNVVIGLMKAANAKTELGFMKGLEHPGKLVPGYQDGSFKINTWLMVAFLALTLAFILHVISKKHKSAWGIIVMIFGYLLFAGVFAAGQHLANLEHSAVWSDESISAWRTWTTVGGTVLAGLMGLGMIRAGSLSGKCKYWKRKKMKNKKLANDRHAN